MLTREMILLYLSYPNCMLTRGLKGTSLQWLLAVVFTKSQGHMRREPICLRKRLKTQEAGGNRVKPCTLGHDPM